MQSSGSKEATGMPFVKFDNVQKSYDGRTLVVKGFEMDIDQGEFITLLGPSGSGKSTVLMMMAGFEQRPMAKSTLTVIPLKTATPQTGYRFGIPELRLIPSYDGGGKPRLSAPSPQNVQVGNRKESKACAGHGALV